MSHALERRIEITIPENSTRQVPPPAAMILPLKPLSKSRRVPGREGFEDFTRHSQVNRLGRLGGCPRVIHQQHLDLAAAFFPAQQSALTTAVSFTTRTSPAQRKPSIASKR